MISQLPCVVKPWLLEFSEFLENIIGHEHKGLVPSTRDDGMFPLEYRLLLQLGGAGESEIREQQKYPRKVRRLACLCCG